MIIVLYWEGERGGSLRTPKSDYVIHARLLTGGYGWLFDVSQCPQKQKHFGHAQDLEVEFQGRF